MTQEELQHLKRNLKHNNEALLITGIGIYHINTAEPGKIQGDWKKYCEKQDMNKGKSGSDSYWDLLEEDDFLSIAKKSLSGKIEDTIIEYSLDEGSLKNQLKHIIDEPNNPFFLQAMVEYISKKLKFVGEYAIMTLTGELSKRSKNTHGFTTTDDDLCNVEGTYRFLLTSICPFESVSLGLYYNKEEKAISHWPGNEHILKEPVASFLYPSMEEGKENLDAVMVYTKYSKDSLKSLAKDIFQKEVQISSKEQIKSIEAVVKTALPKEIATSETTAKVLELLIENDKKPESKEVYISAESLKKAIEDAVPAKVPEDFTRIYEEKMELTKKISTQSIKEALQKKNIVIQIKILKETNQLKREIIDGNDCLILSLDDNVQVIGTEHIYL